MIPREDAVPLAVSNGVAFALLGVAVRWPRVARRLFVLLFSGASIFNALTALRDPQIYVRAFGPLAVLEAYRAFISGPFSRHAQAIVLAIAAGQLAVAALLAAGGRYRRLGAVGAVVFLLAITPLGLGSAFPFPLIAIVAILVMDRRLEGAGARGGAAVGPT
ncbi:MAG TPA: hypothetical protein VFQ38_20120 [Longimicrobiales bacterium]|nr:hypothetical protein [Longimicrobiales bacterium]